MQALRHLRLATVLLGAWAIAAPASADEASGPVVVELFTSQGCSACPPADAMLAELADREDVIALSLHVDYWNYLGWEDTFSQAAFTERQYAYGHAAGSTVVYTPQIIVGGHNRVMGARAMEMADLIAAHRAAPDPVSVTVLPSGGGYSVTADWRSEAEAPDMVVQLVAYSPHERVEISRGENAGRSAEYHNVVLDWSVLREWNGIEPLVLQITPSDDLPRVIIVQGAGHGAILGAARLD